MIIKDDKKPEFTWQSCRKMSYLDSFNDTHFPMHFKDSMEKCSNVKTPSSYTTPAIV